MCETPDDILTGELFKSWDETMKEFREFAEVYCYPNYRGAVSELEYIPPWIDQELLEYSLYGVKSIKLY